MFFQENCRWFSGYKPCKFKRSCRNCPEFEPVGKRIAIISLDAMGAVIRATCLLPAIKRKYPDSHITWITYPQSKALLANNPLTDRIIAFDAASVPLLSYLQFDILYAVDKSLEAGALAETMQASEKWGFGLTPKGTIRPLTHAADYQFQVGLDDELKFYQNQKPETQQITESMGLTWERDPYVLHLTEEELAFSRQKREEMLGLAENPLRGGVIGYNTGCSLLFPNKKFTVERSVQLIRALRQEFPDYCVALLGGPEDTERQEAMISHFTADPLVINTPTRSGLRRGLAYMNTADVVFSGCSLGMHMAIALQKKVIAWFGVSCLQEIDLYERGVRLQAEVSCSPCWKKSCDQKDMCYDRVPLGQITGAVRTLLFPS